SVDSSAPIRLRIAARATAVLGLRAPVAIGVAIAFAVSWKPLVKSKNSASAMTSTTVRVRSSTDYLELEGTTRRPAGAQWRALMGGGHAVIRHSLRVHHIVSRKTSGSPTRSSFAPEE